MTRLRLAVVGCGAVTQSVHLPLLARRSDEVELVAVADLAPGRARAVADRYGVPHAVSGVVELLAAHADGSCPLDAVLLATSGSHAPDLARLTAAGVPVLSEKPLTLSLAEADGLVVDGGAGAPLVRVGYMKEYDPAVAAAATLLGPAQVRHVSIEILHPTSATQLSFARLLPPEPVAAEAVAAIVAAERSALDDAVGVELPERWRRLYADVVVGSLVHQIALLRHLGLPIARVHDAERWGPDAHAGSIRVSAELDGGARLDLAWHFLPGHADYRETYRFHHETGSVGLTFGVPYLLNSPTVLETVEPAPGGGETRAEHRWNQQEAFETELAELLGAVRSPGAADTGTGTGGARSGPGQARADLVTAQAVMAALARRHGWALGGEAAAAGQADRIVRRSVVPGSTAT